MNLGRDREFQYLNELYAQQGSRLVVLYGQKHIGKTTLVMDFIKDKEHLYYLADEASQRQQQYLMARQFQNCGISVSPYPSYQELMDTFAKSCQTKKVLIIDEFDHLVKAGPDFMDAACTLLSSESEKQFLIILCCSSVSFVENQMVSRMGKAALSISAFIKMRDLEFSALSRAFPNYTPEEKIALYGILGGVPGLWRHFDPALTIKQNICNQILTSGSELYIEGESIVSSAVREGSVYYSILSALAGGMDKLGQIYEHTGFSRAKISVYIKNLMELEFAEKVFSLDTRGSQMQRKGIYKISNPFCNFWFRFLYPNRSMQESMSPEAFYDTYIKNYLEDYCRPCFSKICQGYMQQLIMSDDFPFEVDETGLFDGKEGYIDFLAMDEDQERSVCAFCCYDKPYMTYEFYENALRTIASAKVPRDLIYLFARDGFDEKICLEAKVKENITLLTIQDWLS
ncbi:MAG: ATP-binding protein [Lachnospiraceae bacterium]|nr:ATP-binding protein [Lachnospiraceae bacterium]